MLAALALLAAAAAVAEHLLALAQLVQAAHTCFPAAVLGNVNRLGSDSLNHLERQKAHQQQQQEEEEVFHVVLVRLK